MELLLNTIWLVLSLLLLGTFMHRRRRIVNCSRCCAFVAIAFVLVLLFPFISASDDLHAAQFTNEEVAATKRLQRNSSVVKHVVPHPPVLPVAVAPVVNPLALSSVMVHPIVDSRAANVYSASPEGRGPPSFS